MIGHHDDHPPHGERHPQATSSNLLLLIGQTHATRSVVRAACDGRCSHGRCVPRRRPPRPPARSQIVEFFLDCSLSSETFRRRVGGKSGIATARNCIEPGANEAKPRLTWIKITTPASLRVTLSFSCHLLTMYGAFGQIWTVFPGDIQAASLRPSTPSTRTIMPSIWPKTTTVCTPLWSRRANRCRCCIHRPIIRRYSVCLMAGRLGLLLSGECQTVSARKCHLIPSSSGRRRRESATFLWPWVRLPCVGSTGGIKRWVFALCIH